MNFIQFPQNELLMVLICEEMNQLKCNVDAETVNFMIKNVLFHNCLSDTYPTTFQ